MRNIAGRLKKPSQQKKPQKPMPIRSYKPIPGYMSGREKSKHPSIRQSRWSGRETMNSICKISQHILQGLIPVQGFVTVSGVEG
jgi:hypothetical protein